MLRKIVMALILVPLAIALIAFAVANRRPVLISFDPFDQARPAFSLELPLFALLLALLLGGVVVGSLPTTDGTSNTARAGALVLLERLLSRR